MLHQVLNTEGVEERYARQGLLNRALLGVSEWVERLNRTCSKVAKRPVLDVEEFQEGKF
jgi:ornithine lipid ester-linked acyl 2-hydroxylase